MPHLRISEAAILLGVSDDTVRRWIEQDRLSVGTDTSGRKVVDGAELAGLAQHQAEQSRRDELDRMGGRSARNHFTGLVTRIVSDTVMSQIELQAGPFRVVSLISTEAVDELGLEVGSIATGVVKATNVTIERA
ncbi:helix-turn-helix transcriptional regulator [Mariniluteicoccus endophyticus]